jgi:hypothetical protein
MRWFYRIHFDARGCFVYVIFKEKLRQVLMESSRGWLNGGAAGVSEH